jgi:phospholipid/cholesterol/gamma-HCH transport system substrate-binding protein
VRIHFPTAAGITLSTPVRRHGVTIGSVTDVQFDERKGGVVVRASIEKGVRMWPDGQVRVVSSLLGDSAIDCLPGRSEKAVQDGDTLEGEAGSNPLNAIGRIEQTVSTAIESFQQTSREWQTVGRNMNHLLETNQGNLHVVVERAAESLSEFTQTMRTMNQALEGTSRLLGDAKTQDNLRKTLATLPQLTAETQETVAAVRTVVEKIDENLRNLGAVTQPLAKRGVTLATHLESSLTNLDSLSGELAQFAKVINAGNGSIAKLASDPQLYVNLNRSAESAALLLQNLEPILHDLRVFSDKVARHPEIIGVSGAMRGSSGLKDPEEAPPSKFSILPRRTQRQ